MTHIEVHIHLPFGSWFKNFRRWWIGNYMQSILGLLTFKILCCLKFFGLTMSKLEIIFIQNGKTYFTFIMNCDRKTMKCLCKNNWFIYKRIKVIDKSYYSIKFLTSVVFLHFLSWDQLYLLITLLAMYTKISFIFLLIKCNKFPRYSLNVVFVVYYKGVVFTFYVLMK